MKEYCNICQKETNRHKNGRCRSCTVRETWKSRKDIPFEKNKDKSWCNECQKETVHHKNGTCQGCAVRAQWRVRSRKANPATIEKVLKTKREKGIFREREEIECPICKKSFFPRSCGARGLQKYCSSECSRKVTYRRTEEVRQKMRIRVSQLMKEGKWNRYTTGKGGKREDLGHYVRSNWEANVARILKLQNRKYEFEKHSFQLSDGRIYIPDFYLPEENLYIEVKGVMLEKLLSKYNMAREEYPQENFQLISPKEYNKLRKEYKNKILWEGI